MKLKSILSLALLLLTTVAFSQISNLRKAKTSYIKFSDVKSMGSPQLGRADLKAAHDALLKAIEHDKTKEEAETWVYYGLVNADLSLLEDNQSKADEYYRIASEAREKAVALDSEKAHADNLLVLDYSLAQYELNQGIKAWDAEDFLSAYKNFDRAEAFIPGDTTLLYYAGAAAVQGKDYTAALEKYTQLVDNEDFSFHKQILLDIPRIYIMQGDTVQATKYGNLAMEKYPEDSEIATQYIEYNLMAGNEEEVVGAIKAESAKNPGNKTLYYYLGLAYNALQDEASAEEEYKKALAIDPDYVDANINLGGLILNRGIDHWNHVNNQRDLSQQQYETEIKKAHEIFDIAFPYLQKAVDNDDKNLIALSNLQKYYQIKDNQAKADELQAKIDALN